MEREQNENPVVKTYSIMFRALANSSRLRIISLLSEHAELCVCELETALEHAQSRTSYHLGILVDADLISCREEGTWAFYTLNEERLRGLLSPQCCRSLLNQEEVLT